MASSELCLVAVAATWSSQLAKLLAESQFTQWEEASSAILCFWKLLSHERLDKYKLLWLIYSNLAIQAKSKDIHKVKRQ